MSLSMTGAELLEMLSGATYHWESCPVRWTDDNPNHVWEKRLVTSRGTVLILDKVPDFHDETKKDNSATGLWSNIRKFVREGVMKK